MKPRTYDEFGRTRPLDVFATCRRCGRPIKHSQPMRALRPRWGGPVRGWVHALCLAVSNP